MSDSLTFGSLFAGIGGFDLGLERSGMQASYQVEIHPQCRLLLAEKFPAAAIHEDVRKVTAADLPPVDGLVGGFPCQDVSVAGPRAGFAGARSSLFYHFIRIATNQRKAHGRFPTFILFENVAGLLTSDNGRDFARVLLSLARIGYHGSWRVLDAQYLGVAQRRRRVIGCFLRGDSAARRAAEILSIPEGLRGHPPPRRKTLQNITGTLSARPSGGGGLGTDFDCSGGLQPVAGTLCSNKKAAGSATNQDAENGHLIAHALTASHDASEDGTGRGTPLVAEPITANEGKTYCHGGNNPRPRNIVAFDTTQVTNPDNRSQPLSGKRCHTLNSQSHPPAIAFSCKDHGQDAGEISPTLRAMPHDTSHANGGGQVALCFEPGSIAREAGPTEPQPVCSTLRAQMGDNQPAIHSGAMVRRLTPLECERLQGFPDNWTDGFSDAARYRMLGNAVAVPVSEWVGKRLHAEIHA